MLKCATATFYTFKLNFQFSQTLSKSPWYHSGKLCAEIQYLSWKQMSLTPSKMNFQQGQTTTLRSLVLNHINLTLQYLYSSPRPHLVAIFQLGCILGYHKNWKGVIVQIQQFLQRLNWEKFHWAALLVFPGGSGVSRMYCFPLVFRGEDKLAFASDKLASCFQ